MATVATSTHLVRDEVNPSSEFPKIAPQTPPAMCCPFDGPLGLELSKAARISLLGDAERLLAAGAFADAKALASLSLGMSLRRWAAAVNPFRRFDKQTLNPAKMVYRMRSAGVISRPVFNTMHSITLAGGRGDATSADVERLIRLAYQVCAIAHAKEGGAA